MLPARFRAICTVVEATRSKFQVPESPRRVRSWLLCVLVALATSCTITWVDGGPDALPSMTVGCVTSLALAAVWLASAAGIGSLLGGWMGVRGTASCVGVGTAVLLVADQWLGTLGVLSQGVLAPLAALAPGWWLLARRPPILRLATLPTWSTAPIGIACGTLLAAAMVPAGFLWSTEFGGYDALSYHLQVPREWLAAGSMRPLEHLAYAGFPNFVEGGFMHLMALRADPRDAALACQALHAGLLLVAAGTVAETLRLEGVNDWSRGCAGVALLCTPWVIVTGSLAYSEAGVLLGLALAMSAITLRSRWAGGLAFGLGAGLMVGSKASSVTLALPAALAWAMVMGRPRIDPRWWIAWIGTASVALFPWLLRNAWFTTAPMFPLMASHLGMGWWKPAQALRWDLAHGSDVTPSARLAALWHQWLAFGVGDNPKDGEPWRWFWGPLPWFGLASITYLIVSRHWRRMGIALGAMTALTLVGWLGTTHLQSRFLLPLAMPLAVATGVSMGVAAAAQPSMRRLAMLVCLCWSFVAAWALMRDAGGRLALSGRVDVASGALDLEMLASENDAVVESIRGRPGVEATIGGLFKGHRVLSVGWSTPFWLPPDARLWWSTVWDSNKMHEALKQPAPINWLQERFDVVLLDEPMLNRWERSGWLDPELAPARVRAVLAGQEEMPLAGGRSLFILQKSLKPAWPERHGSAQGIAPY